MKFEVDLVSESDWPPVYKFYYRRPGQLPVTEGMIPATFWPESDLVSMKEWSKELAGYVGYKVAVLSFHKFEVFGRNSIKSLKPAGKWYLLDSSGFMATFPTSPAPCLVESSF